MMNRLSEPIIGEKDGQTIPFSRNRQPYLLKLTLTKRKRIESLYIRGDGKC